MNTESTLEVQVQLDENKQPQFKNLMSLASTGPKPLAIDTEEPEEPPKVSNTPDGKSSSKEQYKSKKTKHHS